MEMEILNIPTPSRTRLQAKLRLYKSEAEKLKRDLVKFPFKIPQRLLICNNSLTQFMHM